MDEFADKEMVKKAFEMFSDQRIKEIKADDEYLYVTIVEE